MISINISDLIWTIINFLLLCILLNHFLYKPVLRFMDDRQARVDAKLSEKRDAEAQAAENDARLEAEKAKSRDEAKRILTQADADTEEQHAAAMLQAREDAAQDRKDAEADLEARREKTAEKLGEATPELADLLARHLLGEE
jgi:F-type H+-transporting ATPase subunit b